jgi:prepilin-type N-terminal cleavage/methylation domain-containing protein
MPKPTPKPAGRPAQAGFSLVEMMVSIAILLVVGAIAFSFLSQYQNYYQSSALKADMHSGLRATTVLLEQEIGQAGLVSLGAKCSPGMPMPTTTGCPTLAAAITTTGSVTAQVTSPDPIVMKVGESVLVDVEANEEAVTITAVPSSTQFTANFGLTHPTGAPVTGGVYYQGILSPGQTGGSSASQLNMIGDLIGDGNLYYVQYNCSQPPWSPVAYSSSYSAWNSTTSYTSGQNVNYNGASYVSTASSLNVSPLTAGTLTRSVTNLRTDTTQGAAVTLLDNLGANPGGTACFQYSTVSATAAGTTYNFTTTVSVTLTVQTSEIDPITHTQSQETKSFLNLVPRNVLGAYNLASAGVANFFQPNPTNLCSGVTWSTGTPSPAC